MNRHKKLYELACCCLHPVAVVLIWFNLLSRTDLSRRRKLVWAVFSMIPAVPFLYVLSGGELW